MNPKAIALFLSALLSLIAWVTAPASAQQPAAGQGSRICCNNSPAYAQHLKATVEQICRDKPAVSVKATCQAMRSFHLANKGAQLAQNCGATPVTVAYDCPDEKNATQKITESKTFVGCYPVKELLQAYAQSFDLAVKECGLPEQPPTPPPCPDNCCPAVLMAKVVEKTTPVEITNNNYIFPEPDPPHVPAENLLDASFVSVPRPSDTRAAMVDAPLMFDRNGGYGAVGMSVSPFRLARAEWSNLDPNYKYDFLDHLILSAGASRAPGADDPEIKTNGAGTLTYQLFNDKDLMDNGQLRSCLESKAYGMIRDQGKQSAQDLLKKSKQGYWQCLARSFYSLSLNLGQSTDITRFWWAFEYGYGHHALTPFFGGKQWNGKKIKSAPLQLGVRYTFSAQLFSFTADAMSEVVFSTDGLVGSWFRQHAGLGVSVAVGNGLTASLGARVVPPAWLEHTDTEIRGIASIGWGGWDIGAMYYQNQFTRFAQDANAKPTPAPKEEPWKLHPLDITP
ncbi:MAG: hypothetical protein PHN49_06730 [Candidatus Omnitrophica bacterium]|nr:hypothetical protein [Candidatus Omnitrophota bacterium]